MNCPRCGAHVVDDVVHLEDTPTGLYAVTAQPTDEYVHYCRCGADIAVTSTCAVQHEPAVLRLIGAA